MCLARRVLLEPGMRGKSVLLYTSDRAAARRLAGFSRASRCEVVRPDWGARTMRNVAVGVVFAMMLGCGGTDAGGGGDDGQGAADAGGDEAIDPVGPGFPCAGDETSDDPLVGGDLRCFGNVEDPDAGPVVVIEYAFEIYDGIDAVHVRLTFDPDFVDNTFGDNAMGWDRDHKFKDLVGSDHARVVLLDTTGEIVFDLELDYLSEDPDAPCGYSSLGIDGGSGDVNVGDADAVLGWMTSLDENLNARGYCDYTEDSPATDDSCTPNPDAPDWDFRVVYDVWVRADAFDPVGFGTAHMDSVHASPSKAESNTITVTPSDCPQQWCRDQDECEPAGEDCYDDNECATNEFCGEGHCVPIIL